MIRVVDSFFGPLLPRILEHSDNLPYEVNRFHNFPGRRTQPFIKADPHLYAILQDRLLSYFGKTSEEWQFNMMIQRIPAHPSVNEGWIHSDGDVFAVCLVYLNEDPPSGVGTGFYSPKSPLLDVNAHLDFRNAYYAGQSGISAEDFRKATLVHNSRFELQQQVEAKLDRAVLFDPHVPHRQMGFGWESPRTTFIAFATPADSDKN